jgi:hypothetical protein
MVVVAHGGGAALPDLGDGGNSTGGVLRLQEDNGKLRKDVLILLLASIAVGSGRRQRVTAAARVQLVLSFVGRNPHHGEHYL